MTKHRDVEIMVARSMADSLLTSVLSTSKEPTLTAYAHAFGSACKANDFMPDDASWHRILFDVVRDIGERRRAADKLNTALVRSTAD
jgi:hypothetical protein